MSEMVAASSRPRDVLGRGRPGSLQEQAHGSRLGQGRDREQSLAADAQRGPAGDQGGDPRSGREQAGHLGRGRDHLLEIVQDQQDAAGLPGIGQGALPGLPRSDVHRGRLGDGGQDEIGMEDGLQWGEDDAVEPGGGGRAQMEGEAGLAHPGGADQGDQALPGIGEQGGDLGDRVFAPDQGRQGDRQHRPRRRAVGGIRQAQPGRGRPGPGGGGTAGASSRSVGPVRRRRGTADFEPGGVRRRRAPGAVTSRLTVSRRGARYRPRSRSLIARALTPACSARAS